MDNITYFLDLFPKYLSDAFNSLESSVISMITEIRLRRNKPLMIYVKNVPYFISIGSKLVKNNSSPVIIVDNESFDFITDRLCNHSYHTNMHTMVDGYITAKNGSRVGIAAHASYKDGVINSVRNISSLNIRISHEIKGCCRDVLNALYLTDTPSIIVAGPVMSGKTTFLRDFSRMLSSGFNGRYLKVAVVDEREEISSGFDVGVNTDILTGFEKYKGIEIATRTLSPDIIVCDEIGSQAELDAVEYGFSTGVSLAVSIHIKDPCQLLVNHIARRLIGTEQFDYAVILKPFESDFDIIPLRNEKDEISRDDADNSIYFFPWIDGNGI